MKFPTNTLRAVCYTLLVMAVYVCAADRPTVTVQGYVLDSAKPVVSRHVLVPRTTKSALPM